MTTTTDIGLELADMEDRCPVRQDQWDDETDGAHPPGCPGGCNGTGKVPRFPVLRVPCDGCVDGVLTEDDLPFQHKGEKHKWCQGRGWTVSDRLEDWVECLPGGQALLRRYGSWAVIKVTAGFDGWHIKTLSESSGSPKEALKQALLKVCV